MLLKNWWLLTLRGVSLIIFGFYFFVYPDVTLLLLVRGFVFFAFCDGIFCMLVGFLTFRGGMWRTLFVIIGILDLLAAAFAHLQPVLASVMLFSGFGLFTVAIGVLEIALGIILRDQLANTGWLIGSGIVTLILGCLLLAQPLMNYSAEEYLIGLVQMLRGVTTILVSLSLREERLANRG